MGPHLVLLNFHRLTQAVDFSGLDAEQQTTLAYLVQLVSLRNAASTNAEAWARWCEFNESCPRPVPLHPLTRPLLQRLQAAWQDTQGTDRIEQITSYRIISMIWAPCRIQTYLQALAER